MRLDVDPNSPDDVYATLEANGAMRSRNGGESWEDCTADLIRFCEQPKYRSRIGSQTEIEGMLDGHALACSAAAPGTVFLANRMGLFRSDDKGQSWQDMEIGRFSPLTYGRDIRVSPHDPKVLYACLSPAARSTDGAIYRSDDVGQTWKRFDHGIKAEATMMGVTVHPQRPEPGLRRVALRPGVRHPGWRTQLERAPPARGRARRLRGRLRVSGVAKSIADRHARPCAGHPRRKDAKDSGWPGRAGMTGVGKATAAMRWRIDAREREP